jgi:hypothetical protein
MINPEQNFTSPNYGYVLSSGSPSPLWGRQDTEKKISELSRQDGKDDGNSVGVGDKKDDS